MATSSTTKPKTTRTRRTKADLQQEFEDLVEVHDSAKDSVNTKLDEMIKARELGIKDEIKNLSAESIIRGFADLQLQVSQTLSSLSEKIIQEFDLFSTLSKAVSIEKAEISELHKIDVALIHRKRNEMKKLPIGDHPKSRGDILVMKQNFIYI